MAATLSTRVHGAKLSGGECEDGVGREISVEQGDKSSVDGGRRGSGKLLIEMLSARAAKCGCRVSGDGRAHFGLSASP